MSQLILTCTCGHEMTIPQEKLGATGRCSLCGLTIVATAENTRPAAAPVFSEPEAASARRQEPKRLLCLDQLRGYAIFGMILVNYLGNFGWMPWWFDHSKDHFSYADTIAPLFIFVVGMGFRLSLQRRTQRQGAWEARVDLAKRYLILTAVGIVFYGPAAHIDWWDALVQIGLAGLLSLPFIDKPIYTRVIAGLVFLGLFTGLYLGTGYAVWMEHRSMNGGPLSPFAYCFVLLCGTIAYDVLSSGNRSKIFRVSLVSAVTLLALGIAVYFVLPRDLAAYRSHSPYWLFAKRWSLPPFIFISTGCAFAAFALFYWLNDVLQIKLPHLSVLGMNPLVIYLLQYSLLAANHTYLPRSLQRADASPIPGLIGFVVFYLCVYAVAWRLHKDKTIIKL